MELPNFRIPGPVLGLLLFLTSFRGPSFATGMSFLLQMSLIVLNVHYHLPRSPRVAVFLPFLVSWATMIPSWYLADPLVFDSSTAWLHPILMLILAITSVLVPTCSYVLALRYRPKNQTPELLFASTVTAVHFLERLLSPLGVVNSPTNYFFNFPAMLQSLALFGVDFILFISVLFAVSMAGRFHGRLPARKAISIVLFVGGAMILAGEVRLALSDDFNGTIQVGAVVVSTKNFSEPLISFSGPQPESVWQWEGSKTRNMSLQVLDEMKGIAPLSDFIMNTEWGLWTIEGVPEALSRQELRNRSSSLALECNKHVLISYNALVVEDMALNPNIAENVVDIFAPNGSLILTYVKSKLVPFIEESLYRRGNFIPSYVDICINNMEFRLGTYVCMDGFDVRLASRAGRAKVDVLLTPAADWSGLNPLVGHAMSLRAVENGFNYFRPSSGGQTIAATSTGRIVYRHRVEYEALTTRFPTVSLFARIPTQRSAVVYPYTFDLCGWLSVIYSVVAVLRIVLLRRVKSKSS